MTHQATTFADHYIKLFAKLNGWSRTDKHFSFRQLAGKTRGRRDNDEAPLWWSGDRQLVGNVMDHIVWFRYQRKPIAIMSMPYNTGWTEAQALARLYELEVYAPPIEKSGCWYPDWTYCYVFIRCETGLCWLPQQCEQDAFKQYVAAYREAQAKDRQKFDEDQRRRAALRARLAESKDGNDEEYARDEEDKERIRASKEGFPDEDA